jgi:phosphoglycolate phosphatase/pyrophosphatase PpaX
VSSSSRRLLEAGLEANDLTKYFGSIIAGDDVTKHKPHPESFLQTLERMNVSPSKTLIIGDAKTDILAGQAAGTKTCFFSPCDNNEFYDYDETRKAGPDYEVSKLVNILKI